MAAVSSKSAAIRAKLTHPIIDADGHLIEVTPVLYDYVRAEGGEDMVRRLKAEIEQFHWTRLSPDERRGARVPAITWWLVPAKNSLDRATAMAPRLLVERLDELGLDFCVLYPSLALDFPHLADEDLRRASCRAYNRYAAEVYAPYARRLCTPAVIPMHTPEEAIEELEFAARELGLKAAMIAGHVHRPISESQRERLGAIGQYGPQRGWWYDTFGEDSDYDYDPFWAKAVELGMPLAAHSCGFGFTNHSNVNNFMQNHLGHFANAANLLCKSLFFSGVTRRFPKMRMAFLECGAGWAADLYAGIVARWEKRNPEALQHIDPRQLDEDRIMDLLAAYGDAKTAGKLAEIKDSLNAPGYLAAGNVPDDLNDFARAGIAKPEDIRDRFIPNFFFGCEADDPMNAVAFNPKIAPFGAKVGAMLSSDIGHWDVIDMRDVVEEAYEMVEDGLMTAEDFRDFTFNNPLRFFTDLNPAFFDGTAIEEAAKAARTP